MSRFKYRLRVVSLILILLISSPMAGASYDCTQPINLTFHKSTKISPTITFDLDLPLENRQGSLMLRDGKKIYGWDLADPVIQGKVIEAEGETSIWQSNDGSLRVYHRVEQSSLVSLWTMTFENAAEEEKWVEVEISFPFRFPGDWEYWDGGRTHGKNPDYLSSGMSEGMKGKLPLATVYSQEWGIAFGLEPHTISSYFTNKVDSSNGALYYTTRAVIDPGAKESLQFTFYKYDAAYGYRSAVQGYHDAYPDIFSPYPGIDEKFLYGSTVGLAWTTFQFAAASKLAVRAAELSRRFYTRWEWMYAPFKFAGDIYGKKEYWDLYQVTNASSWYTGSLENFHKQRERTFKDTHYYNIAPAFYWINWMDEKFMDTYGPALISKEDVIDHRGNRLSPWIHGYTTDVRVYPWGNELGHVTCQDMAKVAEELNLTGFAFDVASGGSKFRGDGTSKSPGRAFDERGVYVDEATSIALIMDYLHKEVKTCDSRPPGIVANNTGFGKNNTVYTILFREDNAIFEGTIDQLLTDIRGIEQQRLLMGQKPFSLYTTEAASRAGKIIPWQNMSPDEIRMEVVSMRDSMIMTALTYGYYLSPDVISGYDRASLYLRPIHDVIMAGWQAAPAHITDREVWSARFGKGFETYITLSNIHVDNAIDLCLDVDNKWLGEYEYLVTEYFGDRIEQELDGGFTKTSLNIPRRSPIILEAVLGIKGQGPIIGNAWVEKDEKADTIIYEAEIHLTSPQNVDLAFKVPMDFKVASVLVDGRSVKFQEILKGGILRDISLNEETRVQITLKSKVFLSPEEDILAFNFVDGGKPRIRIVVPDNATPDELKAATAIQWYFSFWTNETTRRQVNIPITSEKELRSFSPLQGLKSLVTGAPSDTDSNLILIGDALPDLGPKVTPGQIALGDDNILRIAGDEDILKLADELLYLLDKKYVYIGVVGRTSSPGSFSYKYVETAQMMQKADLVEATLSYEDFK